MHPAEPLEFLHRTAYLCHKVAYVQLYYLVGIALSRIRNVDTHLHRTVYGHAVGAEPGLGILKRGVAQAVAEWIERVVAHIEIVALVLAVRLYALGNRAPRAHVIVVERYLPYRLRHGHGELSRRDTVAKEHVADGVGSLGASEPHVHDSRHTGLLPCHHSGAAREVEQHHGLAELQQLCQQLALHVGQLEVYAAGALSRHVGALAHGAHYHVGPGRHTQCLGLHGLVVATRYRPAKLGGFLQCGIARKVAPLCIQHRGLVADSPLEPLAQRGVALRGVGHAPRTAQVGGVVGQRAYQRYLSLLLQWQQAALVLKQNKRLGSQFACLGAVLGRIHIGGMAAFVAILVRVGKKAQLILGLKHAPASPVDVVG